MAPISLFIVIYFATPIREMRCHGVAWREPSRPDRYVGRGAIITRDTRAQNLLEFCRFGELNEVLGPITLGDEWLRAFAGLGRCLRACARTGHRKTQRPNNTRVPGGLPVGRRGNKTKQSVPGSSGAGVTPVHKLQLAAVGQPSCASANTCTRSRPNVYRN